MNPLPTSDRAHLCTAALLLCAGAQAQAAPPSLAAAYEGIWNNLEGPVTNRMRITIDKVDADGNIDGTYARQARYCATKGVPLKGKLNGSSLELRPDFSDNVACKDTFWTLQLQADGSLTGTGSSYFQLAATLKPEAK